jgi:4-amino-4-deoxy-L-arabinose transferase-like glycosyltransferase
MHFCGSTVSSSPFSAPSYLAMPFFGLFGSSVASLRAQNVIVGILSLPALYVVLRRTGDKTLALLATFLLAISPWHIMDSRWTLAGLLPTLFLFSSFDRYTFGLEHCDSATTQGYVADRTRRA